MPHRDNYFSSGMPFLIVPYGFKDLAQRVAAIDDRYHLAFRKKLLLSFPIFRASPSESQPFHSREYSFLGSELLPFKAPDGHGDKHDGKDRRRNDRYPREWGLATHERL